MKRFIGITMASALATIAITAGNEAVPAQACQTLTSLRLKNTAITLAEVVPAGGFTRPASGRSSAQQGFSNPVAFCRVAATLTPTSIRTSRSRSGCRSPAGMASSRVWEMAGGPVISRGALSTK